MMYKYCFIMASVSTRQHLLKKFIESARASKYKDADYYIYYQQISDDPIEFDEAFFKKVFKGNKRMGVCFPRMFLLNKVQGYDFYIIVDDDMEFLGKEDYESMMAFSESMSHCGLVCCEYKSRVEFYNKAKPKNEFIQKDMQFIEGGTVVKKSIRDLLVEQIPLKRFAYDGFCIITFINGYTNYKYLGSISLHKLTNGNQGFVYVRKHSEEFDSLFEQYIVETNYDDGDLKLPTKIDDLTDEAIEMHERNNKYGETKD